MFSIIISMVSALQTTASYFYNDVVPFVVANRGDSGAFPEYSHGAYTSSYYSDGIDFIGIDL